MERTTVFMGYVSRHDHVLLDCRLSLPEEGTRDELRRQECHIPPEVQYQTRQGAVFGDARCVGD